MSKHNEEYIRKMMPYARGLQFRTKYWETLHLRHPHMAKIECEPIGSEQSSLKTVMQ